MTQRLMYNKAIIFKLTNLMAEHPEMRFHQLLWAACLMERRDDKVVDKFYEESEDTWKQMCHNNFCFPPNSKEEI